MKRPVAYSRLSNRKSTALADAAKKVSEGENIERECALAEHSVFQQEAMERTNLAQQFEEESANVEVHESYDHDEKVTDDDLINSYETLELLKILNVQVPDDQTFKPEVRNNLYFLPAIIKPTIDDL